MGKMVEHFWHNLVNFKTFYFGCVKENVDTLLTQIRLHTVDRTLDNTFFSPPSFFPNGESIKMICLLFLSFCESNTKWKNTWHKSDSTNQSWLLTQRMKSGTIQVMDLVSIQVCICQRSNVWLDRSSEIFKQSILPPLGPSLVPSMVTERISKDWKSFGWGFRFFC